MRKETFQIVKVFLNDVPKVEDLLQLKVFLYDIDFVDGELIGELCRRSIQKYEKSVKLLRYNYHICYVNNINALSETFWCTTSDTFLSKTGNLERLLVTCSDRFKHIYPKNVYELRKTLFESWMHSVSHIEMSKNCSRIWQYMTLSPFVSRKTHTSKLRLQRELGNMCLYQFLFLQT